MNMQAMINAKKKKKLSGINPELQEKLDLMFGGVVATGKQVWNPSEKVQVKLLSRKRAQVKDQFFMKLNKFDQAALNIGHLLQKELGKRKKMGQYFKRLDFTINHCMYKHIL